MKKENTTTTLIILIFMLGVINTSAQQLPLLNDVNVHASVEFNAQTAIYTFKYEVNNGSSSIGDVTSFDIDISRTSQSVAFDTTGLQFKRPWMEASFRRIYPFLENRIIPIGFPDSPSFWSGLLGNTGIASFFGDGRNDVQPGQLLDGFVMTSKGLPGIRDFIAQPPYDPNDFYPDIDLVSEQEAAQIVAQVDSDRVRLVFRSKTIGPTAPADPFDASTFLDTLISYTTQSLALGWIADQQTADKYEDHFNIAKTQLQQQDTTAARSELQTVLQEVDQDSGSVLTSEAYALLRFNTEYLLDQLPVTQSQYSIFSVFATHSIWLKKNSTILSGSVVVNNSGTPHFLASNVELSVGQKATTPSGVELKAHRIKVKKKAVVNSDVFYNQLTNNGTINGSLNTPLSLPLFTVLPPFQSAPAGAQDITVAKNDSISLAPGDYGDIKVKKKGVILFTGGIYNVRSLNFGNNTKMLFGGPSEVRIEEKFKTGKKTYVGPQNTTTISAKDIVFYVAGVNGKTGKMGASPKSAKVGLNNTVFANFYVPNGMLWLRQKSVVEGAFIGKDVSVGKRVKVTLNSAF